MSMPQPVPFVERTFDPTEWDTSQQRLLAEMADELEQQVGDFRVQSASVHIFEKSAGSVTVKMVAGPE